MIAKLMALCKIENKILEEHITTKIAKVINVGINSYNLKAAKMVRYKIAIAPPCNMRA